MSLDFRTITLKLPLGMGNVNCYHIETEEGHVLIDTGGRNNRKQVTRALERAGCRPGRLKLILLTHGDYDHSGNAAYLRERFGGRIGMHQDDLGMVEKGDMFAGRKRPNFVIRSLVPLFSRIVGSERFSPDLLLVQGDDLNDAGLDARVISIPGHSKGSIGILLSDGTLFCGDLLVNKEAPALNSLMDDPEAAAMSLRRIKELEVAQVYPGHGRPFQIEMVQQGTL